MGAIPHLPIYMYVYVCCAAATLLPTSEAESVSPMFCRRPFACDAPAMLMYFRAGACVLGAHYWGETFVVTKTRVRHNPISSSFISNTIF